jgi:predicted neutral ceramidase superfamily lipid hydrolase
MDKNSEFSPSTKLSGNILYKLLHSSKGGMEENIFNTRSIQKVQEHVRAAKQKITKNE